MIGIEALTAVSTASPFIMLNNAVAVLGGCGAAVVISGALGRDDKREVNATFKNMLAIIVGLTIVLLVFVEGSADGLIRFSGANGRVADLGAAQRVLDLVFVVVWGISQAVNPLVGINYGAGKYGRVRKLLSCFCIWSTISCIITEIIIFVFSEHIHCKSNTKGFTCDHSGRSDSEC